MSERTNRFLGDTPGRVLLKLIIVSLVVGVVMSAFNWSPMDIVYGVENFIRRIWNLGFGAIESFAAYLLLGAAVVVPCFIILRILNYRR
jgi:polyferredoxin